MKAGVIPPHLRSSLAGDLGPVPGRQAGEPSRNRRKSLKETAVNLHRKGLNDDVSELGARLV